MATQSKKSKKHGRNKKKCELYRARGRREKNREKRLLRNMKREEKLEALREKKRAAG